LKRPLRCPPFFLELNGAHRKADFASPNPSLKALIDSIVCHQYNSLARNFPFECFSLLITEEEWNKSL
jgi:hypothetical protein